MIGIAILVVILVCYIFHVRRQNKKLQKQVTEALNRRDEQQILRRDEHRRISDVVETYRSVIETCPQVSKVLDNLSHVVAGRTCLTVFELRDAVKESQGMRKVSLLRQQDSFRKNRDNTT
jgi:hypothetical protein